MVQNISKTISECRSALRAVSTHAWNPGFDIWVSIVLFPISPSIIHGVMDPSLLFVLLLSIAHKALVVTCSILVIAGLQIWKEESC